MNKLLEIGMRLLSTTAFILVISVSQPAFAALESSSVYDGTTSARLLTVADLDSGVDDEMTTGSVCVVPDPQYIPSFVREPDGKIVGIHYTIIEYEC